MTATGDTPRDDRNHPEPSRGFLATGTALAFGTIGASNAGSVEAKQSKLSPYISSQPEAVVEATANCQKVGEACLAFSAKQLGLGMTQLARCQRSCINMLALTSAMLTVGTHATADGRLISDLASVTAKACR